MDGARRERTGSARVIQLEFVSLNMLDPVEVRRDMKRPAQLLTRLRAALGAERRVVVQLRSKVFSVVLAALIQLGEELDGAGGGLALCTADRRHLVFIDMLGLRDRLRVFPTVEQALAELAWTQAGPAVSVAYEVLD